MVRFRDIIGKIIFPKRYKSIGKPLESESYKEKFFEIANKIQEANQFTQKKAFKVASKSIDMYKEAKTEIDYDYDIFDDLGVDIVDILSEYYG